MSDKALFIIAVILILGVFAFLSVQDNDNRSTNMLDENSRQTTNIEITTEKG